MKKFLLLALLAGAFSSVAQADDGAILQSLKKLGLKQTEIVPSPLPGFKTVLTESGVIYVTEDGKHMIQGPLYDVSGAQPVNVTNQLLDKKVEALAPQMIVYKAAKEQHVITVFTDITCGYCRKLHEQMADYSYPDRLRHDDPGLSGAAGAEAGVGSAEARWLIGSD